MTRSFLVRLVVALALFPALAVASPLRSVVIDYETGPLRVFRNDGRYGAAGRWYSASEVGQQRTLFRTERPSVELGFGDRHTLVLLYAPVQFTTQTQLATPLTFRDTTFAAGALLEHFYRFDGYRGSYLFRLAQTQRLRFDLGLSLQIRSATVEFAEVATNQFAAQSDIGLVPALKFRLRYALSSRAYTQLDLDGLSRFGIGDGEGGLLDAALTLGTTLASSTDVYLRLRVYGGGAEVPSKEIRNWAWFGAATFGVRFDLVRLLDRDSTA